MVIETIKFSVKKWVCGLALRNSKGPDECHYMTDRLPDKTQTRKVLCVCVNDVPCGKKVSMNIGMSFEVLCRMR